MSSTAFAFSLLILSLPFYVLAEPSEVCIIGSGISGSSVAHFLREYSSRVGRIRIFERNGLVGGRMATVTVAGETFEAGAIGFHPENFHALRFAELLNLKVKKPSPSSISLGIWNGYEFAPLLNSKLPFTLPILAGELYLRYDKPLLKMIDFVWKSVVGFLKYYGRPESRPVFETVEEMLKFAGLYELTTRTLEEELTDAGASSLLIHELVSASTRAIYGQGVSISGLAGVSSLVGSGGPLLAIEGGNWQMAAGLIDRSNVELHLHEEIDSVSRIRDSYELKSSKGNTYACDVTVVATPLHELNIRFSPAISIPKRKFQHTHSAFVRGVLNPLYFGFYTVSEIPAVVGTQEFPDPPFLSIRVLKKHTVRDMTYNVYSREPVEDALLDKMFSVRNETVRVSWAAYPHYQAPEKFAPFVLDGAHLYYVNTFENAVSSMETSALAAENVARLILSKHP